GAGSTFVQPLVTKWESPVQSDLGISLNYNGVGSTGGVSAITQKQVDFGASDAPLTQFNPTCTTCVQIPWALAATGVIYNLGEGEPKSAGVAGAVSSTPGAIGYVDVYYAVHNHLGLMAMKNRSGKFVLPKAKGIVAAAQLDTHPAKDGSLSIVNPPKSKKYRNAYPIGTYTYVDVQKDR